MPLRHSSARCQEHGLSQRWLTQVYESVKPSSGNGRLLWHALGAKTVDLINENVHVESVHDEVEAQARERHFGNCRLGRG
jgi:type I restriction enzyme R subunit